MRPVATYVAWSVCLFVTTVSPTKTAQRIQQTHRGGGQIKVRCMGYTLAPPGEYKCFSCHLFRAVCANNSFWLVTAPAYIVSGKSDEP